MCISATVLIAGAMLAPAIALVGWTTNFTPLAGPDVMMLNAELGAPVSPVALAARV